MQIRAALWWWVPAAIKPRPSVIFRWGYFVANSTLKELQGLAADPLFQKLVENPKYRPLFRLDS